MLNTTAKLEKNLAALEDPVCQLLPRTMAIA